MRHFWLIGILFLFAGCGPTSSNDCVTGSAGESCMPCEAGFYCAGGETPAEACAEGTWDDDADASTACVAWSVCEAGTAPSGGSTTQNQICELCGAGEFSDGASACQAWTNCDPGQYILTQSTVGQDRTCAICPHGSFTTDLNEKDCVEWTVCDAGEFIADAGTNTSNQSCEPCAAGTFSQWPGSFECLPFITCAPGAVQIAVGTSSAQTVCEACDAGSYCAGGSDATLLCGVVDWDDDLDPATACVALNDCVDDEYVSTAPTSTSDRECQACGAGLVSTGPNADACVDTCFAMFGVTCADFEEGYIKASNTGGNDQFGYSIAIMEDTMVVGAPYEDSNATGIDGDQANNGASGSGAAYVFVRNGSVWSQQAYLKASNAGANDQFGWSVAVSGDTLVVGARSEGSTAIGVNGDQANNGAAGSGAVYVFSRAGSVWSQQAYIKASNTEDGDLFGLSVGLDGDTLVVGALGEDSATTGVDGDQADNGASNSGAAYVFLRTGTMWSQQAYMKASNTDITDYFGASVAISGDTLAIGAYAEASSATGVNGDQINNGALRSGAVYVYSRTGSVWNQEAYVKASNANAYDQFGYSVALSGDTLAIGAPNEDSVATGIDGDQTDNGASSSGAAYVFSRTGTMWSQQAYIKASNTEAGDIFGYVVSLSGDTLAVGAYHEDGTATEVDGDQADNGAADSGAVYLFSRTGTTWDQQAYMKASNAELNDEFGFSVAVWGNTLAISAHFEGSASTGVDDDQSDNTAADSGAVYLRRIAP